MAAKVDLSGIFDNALPMAYIRKITLSGLCREILKGLDN